jgi:hypothetical protein
MLWEENEPAEETIDLSFRRLATLTFDLAAANDPPLFD